MGQLEGIDWRIEEDEVVTELGKRTSGFMTSFFVSALGAGFAMLMFIKSGPCGLIGEKWSRETVKGTGLCFVSGFLTLAGKIYFLYELMRGTSGTTSAERAAVWISFMLLPQLLLSLLALGRATGCRRLFSIIGHFPALLVTPVIFSLAFGPNNKKGYLSFSPKYTSVNAMITVVMTLALTMPTVILSGGTRNFPGVSFSGFWVVVLMFGQFCAAAPNARLAKMFDVSALNIVSGESETVDSL